MIPLRETALQASADLSVDDWLESAASRFGTPAFVYVTPAIAARNALLREAFGGRFALSFAAKSNPNPALLAWLKDGVDYLDISSIGEFRLGVQAGWSPDRLSFTGPAKRDFELTEAIAGGIGELVLESVREAVAADRIAGELGRIQDVMIRLAPSVVPKGFGDQMAGRPCAFGLDLEDAAEQIPQILALGNLRVVGLHVYSGTQCRKAEAIAENYRIFLHIFREISESYHLRPRRLIFGSGLGIPYHDGDAPLDLAAAATAIAPDLDAFRAEPRFAGTELVLELGRYLVGEAGYFLTSVVSIKQSRGSRIAICDGGMNNHLPASGHFGMVIHRTYKMHKLGAAAPLEKVDLVGPLCTSIDRLASGAMLPRLTEGDVIAIHNSGAYGLTASPLHFISHAAPREILADGTDLHDITRL